MVAPVCRIEPDTKIDQPTPPLLPGIPIPEPNMDSIMNMLNIMRQYMLALSGQTHVKQQPYHNPLTRKPHPNQPGAKNNSAKSQPKDKQGRWLELSRKTEKVKITNPNDKEQFLIVQRTNQLILKDSVTGEQWVYNRGSGGDSGGNSADGGQDG